MIRLLLWLSLVLVPVSARAEDPDLSAAYRARSSTAVLGAGLLFAGIGVGLTFGREAPPAAALGAIGAHAGGLLVIWSAWSSARALEALGTVPRGAGNAAFILGLAAADYVALSLATDLLLTGGGYPSPLLASAVIVWTALPVAVVLATIQLVMNGIARTRQLRVAAIAGDTPSLGLVATW